MGDWDEPFELDDDHMERVRESRPFRRSNRYPHEPNKPSFGTGGRENVDYVVVNDGWLSRRIYKKPLDLS